MNSEIAVDNFKDIIGQFKIEEDDFETVPFGSGHINDTFLLRSLSNAGDNYLLQRLNHFVFKDIDGLMRNMVYVTRHLKQKSEYPEKEVLTLIECHNGKYYHQDMQGNYWRMTTFLNDTKSYDIVSTTKQAYQGGVAFGRFQHHLCDLFTDLLVDTIPNFLNIEKRLNDLYKAIGFDKAGRVESVRTELDFLLTRADSMNEILRMGKAGILPLRVTHNDTKFNNILLDQNDEIQCVIDLDTVMPGYVAYDFGDAIRSIINTAAEDEKDLDAIQLNMPLYEAFTKGYLSQASFLTEPEVKSLVKGVLLLPYMQAVRFLTDYLEGDVYYKTHFSDHNLQRTRAQIELLRKLEINREKLTEIVEAEWLKLFNK